MFYKASKKSKLLKCLIKLKAVETLTSLDSHILKKFSETVQIFFSSPIVTIPTLCRKLVLHYKYFHEHRKRETF